MTVSLALMLVGCNASTRSVDAVQETAKLDARLPDVTPSADLLRTCARPVRLTTRPGRKAPIRKMAAGAVERAWRGDRAALIDCGDRKRAVQEFYAQRDAGLAGNTRDAGDSGRTP